MLAFLGSIFKLLVRFSDLVNSNICVTKMYWTKSNFLWKSYFKSDEDGYKHSLATCEGIVEFRHTFFSYYKCIYECTKTPHDQYNCKSLSTFTFEWAKDINAFIFVNLDVN